MWICEKGGHCVDSCEGCEHYVEMVEVKRGRWEYKVETVDSHEEGGFSCSLCGYEFWNMENFCPNCGADMREVDHAKT